MPRVAGTSTSYRSASLGPGRKKGCPSMEGDNVRFELTEKGLAFVQRPGMMQRSAWRLLQGLRGKDATSKLSELVKTPCHSWCS